MRKQKKMVGRNNEHQQLIKLLNSNESEFVAVYGRRRVGKTYLIKETFKGKFAFWHTGLSPYDRDRNHLLQDQLVTFLSSLSAYGLKESRPPKSWMEAFYLLEKLIESNSAVGKKVIFIDEPRRTAAGTSPYRWSSTMSSAMSRA